MSALGSGFLCKKRKENISRTNGLKGRSSRNAAPNLEPGRITPVHWTMGEKSLLEIIIKDPSTPKQPVDLLNNDFFVASQIQLNCAT